MTKLPPRRNLSVGAVAKRQGIGPRYVQRLFEGKGTSFSQFVLRQRLALAHASWPTYIRII